MYDEPCVQVQYTWVGQKIQGLCHRLVGVWVEWQSNYRVWCHGMEGSSSGLLEGDSEGASSFSWKQVVTNNLWLVVASSFHLYGMKFCDTLLPWVLGITMFCYLKCPVPIILSYCRDHQIRTSFLYRVFLRLLHILSFPHNIFSLAEWICILNSTGIFVSSAVFLVWFSVHENEYQLICYWE